MTKARFEDVVGQFPQLKSYNHGFDVVTALEAAITDIVANIPWLGEQVVHECGINGSSGIIRTAPWPTDLDVANRILYVKDHTEVCPSYDELLENSGPVSMLDGSLLCPLPGFPLSYDVAKIGGAAPVVAVQASFIRGGVIINFSNQHNVMDASGMFVFIMLLAIAMQGKSLPQAYIDQANSDRTKVIPLLEPGEPLRDHSHLLKQVDLPPSVKAPPIPSEWAFFRLRQDGIPQIKAAASNKDEFEAPVTYISTNDALCAFYWKRLATVRLKNGSVNPSASSKFSRAIDARAAVGAPPAYMGQLVYHAATRATYQELGSAELTLSRLASRMRIDLDASNNEWAVRSYATFLAGVSDKSQLVYAGGLNPTLDVGGSSMAQTTTGALKFGVLGTPSLLRRPNLFPVPGLMYVYPPELDTGDLPILVCLNEQDMEGLRTDAEWSAYAEFIG
ncbi:trichothecene biosynthesis acetyltransferase [Truncatella angustata]|uniref:Trichothecene biosynthesis acetyltransferase n=1 Tax=Truncatella angustata TaxID=152316 RepID=A0A9P9A216_9PEZI|nr:trichothecene biosynthesis acetyltransferase [Truncatella angustata]KAH6658937.1 trichothecene biosynthesis acetyltransferase [Truncatella angustata]